MSEIDATLQALEKAVRLAPDNIELTRHYVTTLVDLTRYDQAESILKDLIADRNSPIHQLLLADVFYRANKNSHAMAIVETLVSSNPQNAAALVLLAKLEFRAGEVASAVSKYKQAIDQDENVADADFASLLGIRESSTWSDDENDEDDDEYEDEIIDGRLRQMAGEGDSGRTSRRIEKPEIDFDRVGGMESVKEQIRVKIIFPITHAEMFAAYGKKAGGGILMYGPPGCGKTYIARATAGEVKANFIAIGINDVLDMWIGNSERNLHELFEEARRNRPCVLFFDEVDALGASRSDMRQSAGRHLVNQFLSELDGIDASNEGILILGATNAPWHVDSAFRRPGRFDEVLFVPPPDEEARKQVLSIQLDGKPTQKLDLAKVAARTHGYSGADLGAVVNAAVESKLQLAVRTGNPTPITTKDLLTAVKSVRPSTTEWFATAKNHAIYSNQGGTYDDILDYLKLKK